MRALILTLAISVGCFNPTTNKSCQYQCATQGTPCPSGLVCLQGMCVVPGESNCTAGDGGIDAPADAMADARIPVCGDGFNDPGEICYGTPVTITGTDVTYDGQLADIDGDGDLDLVYMIGDQYVFHFNSGGTISTSTANGPTAFAQYFRAVNLDGTADAELINVSDTYELWKLSGGSYTRTGLVTPAAGAGTVVSMAMGPISSTRPNVVVLTTANIFVLSHDANLALTTFTSQAVTGGEDVAVGMIDNDTIADVVTAQSAGVKIRLGTASGLAAVSNTGMTSNTTGIGLGDFNADGKVDIGFSQINGGLGVLLQANTGGGVFGLPAQITVGSIQKPIEVARIDGDLRSDLIGLKSNTTEKAVVIALAKVDGTLGNPVELPLVITPNYVNVNADLNGDGAFEIVVTDVNLQKIVVFPSNP